VRGKEDIDIALNNMSGKDFALLLNQWYESQGLKTVKVGIIQSNPEKSKHLETGELSD
jgi:tRNA nucleotidyltransferase (CCA-adding enzyme)